MNIIINRVKSRGRSMNPIPKTKKIDRLERRIIELLQEDGRMPFVKMAQILGINDATIRKKYNALVEDGVVRVSALFNPYAVGFDAPVFIGINIEQGMLDKITEVLTEIQEIQFIAVTTGAYEIMAQAVLASNQDLYAFIRRVSSTEGVKGTYTYLMLDICKQNWSLVGIDRGEPSD